MKTYHRNATIRFEILKREEMIRIQSICINNYSNSLQEKKNQQGNFVCNIGI